MTMSFHGTRTMGCAFPPDAAACSWALTIGSSFGECSVSSRIQSKPAPAMISTVMLLDRLDHNPICSRPLWMACLKVLTGIFIVLS
jgi:hypothetical protein